LDRTRNVTPRSNPNALEFETQAARCLVAATAMRDPRHAELRIDPLLAKLKTDDQPFAGEYWIRRRYEESARRKVQDPVTNQAKIALAHQLAGEIHAMASGSVGMPWHRAAHWTSCYEIVRTLASAGPKVWRFSGAGAGGLDLAPRARGV
jgi:hypothetical protein